VAVAQLPQHLHVEERPLLEPLGLQEPVPAAQERQPLAQLVLDGLQRAVELLGRRHVVTGRVDVDLGDPFLHLTPERVEAVDGVDGIAEQLDPDRRGLLVGRKDLDHVAAHAECPPVEVVVVALVLHGDEPADDGVPVHHLAFPQGQVHVSVRLGGADAVDAGDRRHHHHVPPLEQRAGGRVPHAVDLVVDERVLLDVGVRLRDVGLGLVVVVVRHEVLDRVVREEGLELAEELGGQGLVGRQHQRGAGDIRDEVGDRVRLPRAGHAAQHGVSAAVADEAGEIGDRPRLIAARRVLRRQAEHRASFARTRWERRPGISATNPAVSARGGAAACAWRRRTWGARDRAAAASPTRPAAGCPS
jgi:hypothetical protein